MKVKRGGNRKENSQSMMQIQHLRQERKEAALSRESLRVGCRAGKVSADLLGALKQRLHLRVVSVGLKCQALNSLPCSMVALRASWKRHILDSKAGALRLETVTQLHSLPSRGTVSLEERFERVPLWLPESPNHFSLALQYM